MNARVTIKRRWEGSRVRVALHVLRGRPTMYRLLVTSKGIHVGGVEAAGVLICHCTFDGGNNWRPFGSIERIGARRE